MKDVAYIKIGTNQIIYSLIVPNIGHQEVKDLIAKAKKTAEGVNGVLVKAGDPHPILLEGNSMIFEFENERLEISEEPLFIHHYISNENYPYNTPKINTHVR